MSATRTVFMFPGQSSRYPEMIEKLVASRSEIVATVISRASELLGRDLAKHYRSTNDAIFAKNRDVQVGVFLANHLHLVMLESASVHAEHSLGSSLGEYNHLVHIGALGFDDALALVDQRGRLYDEAYGGAMVAVFPIEADIIERAICHLDLSDRVSIGLYNSPRQHVLSGERAAVEAVVARLEEEETYLHATEIEARIPMHARALEPIASKLSVALLATAFASPRKPYVPNVLGRIVESPEPSEIRMCLKRHVHDAVRWQASVEAVAARVSSPLFVEVGPRSILHDLFGRGWTPGRRAKTDAREGWLEHFQALTTELAHAA